MKIESSVREINRPLFGQALHAYPDPLSLLALAAIQQFGFRIRHRSWMIGGIRVHEVLRDTEEGFARFRAMRQRGTASAGARTSKNLRVHR